jgi:hypothetical protein
MLTTVLTLRQQVSYRLLNPSFSALLVLPPLLKFLIHLHSLKGFSSPVPAIACGEEEGDANQWRKAAID